MNPEPSWEREHDIALIPLEKEQVARDKQHKTSRNTNKEATIASK